MHPLLMSALISGGINALQGKRGSNLLKSTVKDTLMSAALMGGTNLAMGQPANPFAKNFAFMGMNATCRCIAPDKIYRNNAANERFDDRYRSTTIGRPHFPNQYQVLQMFLKDQIRKEQIYLMFTIQVK